MAETDEMELDLLRRRADACGMYVNRHKEWDPNRGNGDLYLQRKKKFRYERNEDVLRYATADQIHNALCEIENRSRS